MKLRIAQSISIMPFAWVAGVFWGTRLSLNRLIAGISPELFVGIGKAIIQNLAVPMEALRDRWKVYHTVRTIVSLGALASVVIASMVTRR